MTNAIEQSKREMYAELQSAWEFTSPFSTAGKRLAKFEGSLEAHLELLRQDHEALHETARKRFEDIQSLEAVNKDLIEQLSSMTEKRDALRNFRQASEHAYSEQQSKLHPCMVEEKGLQDDWDAEFKCDLGKPRKCLHDDCKARKEAIATMARENGDRVSCATLDGKTAAILGAVVDCQRITADWAMNGLKAKQAMRLIAGVVNGEPKLYQAMLKFERPGGTYGAWFINNTDCMHSFHPAFPGGEQCVFCGVGK